MNKTQKRIQAAYAACYKLCEHSRDAETWLTRSLDAARRGEAQHRKAGARFTQGAAAYKLPIADAARYFAVKWFLELGKGPETWADACALREDCLYAKGARDSLTGDLLVRGWAKLREEYADVLALDYSEVFAA